MDQEEALGEAERELGVCLRELDFCRKELETARAEANSAEGQRQRELAELRSQVCDLSARASAACQRGVDSGFATLEELVVSRRELADVHSELMAAEAEVEFAFVISGGPRRASDAQHAEEQQQALLEEIREVDDNAAEFLEEQGKCEGVASQLRAELCEAQEESSECKQYLAEVEEELQVQTSSLASYEARARELHDELQHLLSQLRAGHAQAQRERSRLAEHIASLERDAGLVPLALGPENGGNFMSGHLDCGLRGQTLGSESCHRALQAPRLAPFPAPGSRVPSASSPWPGDDRGLSAVCTRQVAVGWSAGDEAFRTERSPPLPRPLRPLPDLRQPK
mmetsp:Transcript_15400/g.33891  ORF Transcript_15400/g.33891 Transcript_15400/m.33891 type:complete len:340 (+) Transcript_15400:95-1114(+)